MYDDFLGDNFPFESFEEEDNIDDEVLRELVQKDIIIQMENNINTLGHKRTWEIIEGFSNAIMRARYRKFFFLAGGLMPEREI